MSAIDRSRAHTSLTYAHYATQMSRSGAAQNPRVASLLGAGRALVDEVEEAYKELESNHRPPSLTEAYNEFSRSLIEYRDSVLFDLVMSSQKEIALISHPANNRRAYL